MHLHVLEAQHSLPMLIDKAISGEEVIIQKDDTEVQLVLKTGSQIEGYSHEPRRIGTIPGIIIADDFDEFDDELAEMFGMKEQ